MRTWSRPSAYEPPVGLGLDAAAAQQDLQFARFVDPRHKHVRASLDESIERQAVLTVWQKPKCASPP